MKKKYYEDIDKFIINKMIRKIGSVVQKHKIKFLKFIKLQIFGKEFVIILFLVLILKNLK
jgi:hypothetical protein